MTYNKKQMQPLIDKYAINPETNKLFINVCEMFDNQPNYQIWAVKMIFSKVLDIEQLETIHNWATKNQGLVKMLAKQNIVSYSNKTSIAQLFNEMDGLDNISLVKNTINHFNTEQRKMLNESIFTKDFTAIEGYTNNTIKKWASIFKKFNRLPLDRKNKFYSNCSRLKNCNSLLTAIEESINETYEWNKEDFLAFLANNASDCEVVLDNGSYVIVHVPSFKSSQLLCGNGRTTWCITQTDNFWKQYVGQSNRDQYFLFDFSRIESDAFAHIGFTMENGRGFYCAQTCNNQPMVNGYEQGNERLSINQVLTKAGADMSIFLRLNPLTKYKWDFDSIVEFVKAHPAEYAIAYEKDGRLIINVMNNQGAKELCAHTLITDCFSSYNSPNNKVYVFLDTNLKYNNSRSLLTLSYKKDTYGSLSLVKISDPFNTDVTKEGYLSSIGISSDDFLDREAIDPKILLHKYIDENDEIGALKLLEKEGKNLNVNFEFNQRVPAISAMNNKMYKLFAKLVDHPSFDSSVEDGFGETLLESMLYLYGSEEISSSKEEEDALKKMISIILESTNYDFNAKDLNSDTAINIACEYPKMVWVVEALASNKKVDVNIVSDFECAALGSCIRNKNLEALKIIGQRPDVKVTSEDKKLAKAFGINLDEYIKPNEAIFKSKAETKSSSVDELELVMSA